MKYVIPAVLALGLVAGAAHAQSTTTAPNTAPPAAPSMGTPSTGTPPAGTTSGNMNTGATRSDANNNAVNTAPQNNPGAPQPGANSFTEGQAKSRIEDRGFSQVTDLRKDDQGIWRGSAMKDGKQTSVALDYQGNVTAQ